MATIDLFNMSNDTVTIQASDGTKIQLPPRKIITVADKFAYDLPPVVRNQTKHMARHNARGIRQ